MRLISWFNRCMFVLAGTSLIACSAFESGIDRNLASVKGASCGDNLKQIFSQSYQPFLVTNCASCHMAQSVGKGAFADSNIDLAFEEFQIRGSKLVTDRAVDDNHQPPYTGPQLQNEVNELEIQWQAALTEAASCNDNSDDDNDDDEPLPDDEPIPDSATYSSTAMSIGDASGVSTVSWNLGTDIALPAGTTRQGATFSVEVQSTTTATGEKNYLFQNPRLTAGAQALRIAYVEIYLNDEFMGNASTFRGIDRHVPANEERLLSQTTMVVPFDFSLTDTLKIAFGILDPVDFNPQTYTQLTANIFQQSCVGCHRAGNAAGGLDMTDYDGMLAQYMVIPFSLAGSEIYKRMNDEVNPMPPAGLLPENSRNSVRDWIRDGAPE